MKEGRIGSQELISAVTISCITKTVFAFGTITSADGSGIWQSFFVSTAIMALILLMAAFSIKKTNADDLIGAVRSLWGTAGANIFNVVLGVIQWFGAFMVLRGFSQVILTNIFEATPIWYVVLIIMAASLPLAWMGLEVCTRTSRIVFPLMFISIVILLAGVIPTVNTANLFPLAGNGVADIGSQSVLRLYQWSDLLLVLTMTKALQGKRAVNLSVKKAFVMCSVLSGLWVLAVCSCFNNQRIAVMQNASYEVSELVHVSGIFRYIGLYLVYIWLAGTMVCIAFSLYLSARQIGAGISVKNHRALLPPLFATCVFGQIMLENGTKSITVVSEFVYNWVWVPLVVIVIAIFLKAVLVKRR